MAQEDARSEEWWTPREGTAEVRRCRMQRHTCAALLGGDERRDGTRCHQAAGCLASRMMRRVAVMTCSRWSLRYPLRCFFISLTRGTGCCGLSSRPCFEKEASSNVTVSSTSPSPSPALTILVLTQRKKAMPNFLNSAMTCSFFILLTLSHPSSCCCTISVV